MTLVSFETFVRVVTASLVVFAATVVAFNEDDANAASAGTALRLDCWSSNYDAIGAAGQSDLESRCAAANPRSRVLAQNRWTACVNATVPGGGACPDADGTVRAVGAAPHSVGVHETAQDGQSACTSLVSARQVAFRAAQNDLRAACPSADDDCLAGVNEDVAAVVASGCGVD
jgi:hypothetical protein